MRPLGQALIHSDWCAWKKRKFGHTGTPGRPHRGRPCEEVAKQAGTHQPEREASGGTRQCMDADPWPPEQFESSILLPKPPNLESFRAALANGYS